MLPKKWMGGMLSDFIYYVYLRKISAARKSGSACPPPPPCYVPALVRLLGKTLKTNQYASIRNTKIPFCVRHSPKP